MFYSGFVCFKKRGGAFGGSGLEHESETFGFSFERKMSFSGFCRRRAVSCLPHACVGISELNYGSFRFPHQSPRLQGASLSHLSTLLFKWAITLKGVDTNFPLQISYDFHDRFLWALSTTLPARRGGSIAELSFVPPFFPALVLLMLF